MGKLAVCCSTQLFVNLSICPTPILQGGAKFNKIQNKIQNTKYKSDKTQKYQNTKAAKC